MGWWWAFSSFVGMAFLTGTSALGAWASVVVVACRLQRQDQQLQSTDLAFHRMWDLPDSGPTQTSGTGMQILTMELGSGSLGIVSTFDKWNILKKIIIFYSEMLVLKSALSSLRVLCFLLRSHKSCSVLPWFKSQPKMKGSLHSDFGALAILTII